VTIDPRSSKVVGWDKIFAIIEAEDKERKDLEEEKKRRKDLENKLNIDVLNYLDGKLKKPGDIDDRKDQPIDVTDKEGDPNDTILSAGIAQFRDYMVKIEDNRNFILQHRTDETKQIIVQLRPGPEGGFEWVGLPDALKMQLTVFND